MAPMIAAVVLAAGASSRMAPYNKLLLCDAAGRSMVGCVARACRDSRVDEVVVVLGYQAAAVEMAVRAAVPGGDVRFVAAPGYLNGMSASLKAGIAAVDDRVAAAVVCLGDMPLVGATVIDQVLAGYDPARQALIVVPTCGGARGNPVLWDRRYFAEMAGLAGDAGARGLLRAHAARVVAVETGSVSVLSDFDTVDSLNEGV